MSNNLRSKMMYSMLMAVVISGTLAGCGSKSEPTSQEAVTTGEAKTEETAPAEETILKVSYKKNVLTEDLANNKAFKELEEKTGIKIEWTYLSDTDWDDQKALILASGDIPDIIFGDAMTKEDIINNKDYFLPLEDYIENCPNIKAAFEKYPELRKRVTATDGHIYTLPNRQPCMPNTQDAFFINQKWLDNLGLKMPTTADELYNILKAFKEQDANGNGNPNDEIPLTAQGNGIAPLEAYFGFFGAIDNMSEYKTIVKDGKVSYLATDEGVKEAVKFFHKLYEEGILDQEIFTQDYSMMQAKFQNSDACIVGMGSSWVPSAIVSENYLDQYVIMSPVKGTEGNAYTRYNPEIFSVSDAQFSISTSCPNPETAMRWADALYDEEVSIQTFFGPFDVCVEKTEEGKYNVLEPQEGLSGDIWTWTNAPKSHGPKFVSDETVANINLPSTSNEAVKLAINEQYQPYISEEYYPRMSFDNEVVNELVAYKADFEPYRDEQIATWVVNGGVEEEWDAYVEKMNNLGVTEYIQILQKYYDDYYKN